MSNRAGLSMGHRRNQNCVLLDVEGGSRRNPDFRGRNLVILVNFELFMVPEEHEKLLKRTWRGGPNPVRKITSKRT